MKVALDISPLQSGHKVRGVGFYLKHLKSAYESQKSDIEFQFTESLTTVKNVDLIHFPYFDPFSPLPFSVSGIPTVVTIHDLTPIKFNRHFPAGIKGSFQWQLNKLKARKFAAVITDSNSSKEDIIKYLSYPKEKIHVVYLAAGELFKPKQVAHERSEELRRKYHLPPKFVLYVGDVTWNKNIPRLIEACVRKELPLVLVGKALAQTEYDRSHPWNKDLVISQRLITTATNVSVLGFVEDKDLVDLYRIATVFAMPSLYEGFGLPVIEAMQSGCPVVTSQEGSLPEVGGDAVMYVNASDVENIGEGIKKVFESAQLQKELRMTGIAQAAKFSWIKTAEQTSDIYRKVFEQK